MVVLGFSPDNTESDLKSLRRKGRSILSKNRRNVDSPTVSHDTPRHEIARINRSTMHRVVCGELVGEWYTYSQIATLMTPTGLLNACTNYHFGKLPTNAVFVTTVVS